MKYWNRELRAVIKPNTATLPSQQAIECYKKFGYKTWHSFLRERNVKFECQSQSLSEPWLTWEKVYHVEPQSKLGYSYILSRLSSSSSAKKPILPPQTSGFTSARDQTLSSSIEGEEQTLAEETSRMEETLSVSTGARHQLWRLRAPEIRIKAEPRQNFQ